MEENITGSEDTKEVSQGVGLIMYVDITVTEKEQRNNGGEEDSETGAKITNG